MRADVRKTMLQVLSDSAPDHIQTRVVVEKVVHQLGLQGTDGEQAALTCWHDLMRGGFLAWGLNLANPEPPWAHLTERGRKALEHLGRDPSNPDGYLSNLKGLLADSPIAMSYVRESLETYNADCYRAAAVMIGVAAEALALQLRDELLRVLQKEGAKPTAKLQDWKLKSVLDAMRPELEKRDMPKALAERFAYWEAFAAQIRFARNDAGHPTSIDPLTADTVHASMLIFPELAKLVLDLRRWLAEGK